MWLIIGKGDCGSKQTSADGGSHLCTSRYGKDLYYLYCGNSKMNSVLVHAGSMQDAGHRRYSILLSSYRLSFLIFDGELR